MSTPLVKEINEEDVVKYNWQNGKFIKFYHNSMSLFFEEKIKLCIIISLY